MGEENSSREYTGSAIQGMVRELKKDRWTFTYIGTDHDISSVAATLAIDNTLTFDNSPQGIQSMFEMERKSRAAFYGKIGSQEDLMMDYFPSAQEDE